jgi:integrase
VQDLDALLVRRPKNPRHKGAKKGHRGWGTIRKLPSGKFQASYIGKDLVRHTAERTFDNRLNAEGWLANEKNYLDRCTMTGEAWKSPEQRREESKATVLLLRDYGKQWIEQRRLKETTRVEYLSKWNNLIEPKLGDIALADLSAEAVRAWYAWLGSDQPTRRKHAYALLHGICKTALNDELIQRNPCQIEGAMTSRRKREPEILTPTELAIVVGEIPARFQALVLLAAWCGMRWGEVTELKAKDFKTDCSMVTISRGVTHKGQCRVATTKSDKVRKVLIPPAIRPAIQDHLKQWADPSRDGQLFVPIRGGCHVNDQVFAETWFQPALTKAKRSGVHIHDLRHFGATMLSHVGASAAEVQAFLGHSTPHMAMQYTAATDERRTILAQRLSELAESA